MNFRTDIQGLRAVAVLSVIIFHLNPAWLPGGFVGVDIFLVISGYLIASILLHKKAKADYCLSATLIYFYSSRFKRIAPAYFATLVLASLLAAVLFLPADFATYRDGLKQAVWFNSNNYFADFDDYFAPANHEQPLLHTWSLAIELQFYLIAPFIFLLVARKYLQWLLPAAIILLTAYAEYRLQAGVQQTTYYSLLARLPAFFLGSYVALWIDNSNSWGGNCLKLWAGLLAAGLIAFALVIPKPTGHFPGLTGLIPTVASALIIRLNADNRVTAILSCKTMVWIGALSYSLYLWHWPVLAFMRYYTGAEILNWQFSLAFIAITLFLATASYYWIETPLRLERSSKQILSYGCMLLVTLATALGMQKMNIHFAPEQLPLEYTRYADPATICHGRIVGDCLKGDLNSNKEVLVLGDSHAAMLNLFFNQLGKELGFKARIITASSCVTIPGFDYQRIAEWAQKSCLEQIGQAQKYLSDARMIFLAASWNWQLSSENFKENLSIFLAAQSQAGSKIYILEQEPLLSNNPLRTLRFKDLGLAPKNAIDHAYLQSNASLQRLAERYPGVSSLNFEGTGLFEQAPFADGLLLYLDEHHLNETGVRRYATAARSAFKKIMD